MSSGGAYPLEPLLRVRITGEEQAAAALASRIAEAAAAEQALRALEEALSAAHLLRVAEDGAIACQAADLQRAAARREQLQHEIESLAAGVRDGQEGVRAALAAIERARAALAEAARQRRAIEKHREGWELERRRARERVEQDALDDSSRAPSRRSRHESGS